MVSHYNVDWFNSEDSAAVCRGRRYAESTISHRLLLFSGTLHGGVLIGFRNINRRRRTYIYQSQIT